MLMMTKPFRAASRLHRPPGGSLRLQMLLLAAAVVSPALLFWFLLDLPLFAVAQVNNSAVCAGVAVILANHFLRRMTAFPGVKTFRFILPCNAAAYGGVLAIVLIARISYSSVYFATSFLLSVAAATALLYAMERRTRLCFYLVPHGRIEFSNDLPEVEWRVLNEPRLPPDPSIPIVADLRHDLPDSWERMLADAALRGQPVYHIKQLRESLTGQVSIEHLSENSFGSLIPNIAYARVKRIADVTVSALLLPVLALPLMALAVAIRIESPGPALFRQRRMGAGGREFDVLKFRSMYQQAHDADPSCRRSAMTQNADARVTRIGRIIRKARIDELPQLINVLRGEMSLIGPRPEALSLSQWYEEELPFYVYRHIVRPGITGWAQVKQGHVTDLQSVTTNLHYDFYYIQNYSAWLDIVIAMRTIGIMLTGFGAK